MTMPPSERPDPTTRPSDAGLRRIVGKLGNVYEIVSELAPGGMAETFVARRRGVGESEFLYCIKRMRMGAKRLEFLSEAKIASRLRHDRIVRAVDADVDVDGFCFLALELIDGVDLARLLEFYERTGRPMPVRFAVYIVLQVLEALDFVHHYVDVDADVHDLVHRDVTPSNILITRYGYVKLLDFGIAKWTTRQNFTKTGAMKGKVPYSSPEHFKQKAMKMDGRADLFSLGATFYEMLSGRQAFGDRDDEASTYEAIHQGLITPLRELVPELDPALAEIPLQMMKPLREERPANARAVTLLLRAVFQLDAYTHEELAKDIQQCLELSRPTEGDFDDTLAQAHALLQHREIPLDQLPTTGTSVASDGATATWLRDTTDEREPTSVIQVSEERRASPLARLAAVSKSPLTRRGALGLAAIGIGTAVLLSTRQPLFPVDKPPVELTQGEVRARPAAPTSTIAQAPDTARASPTQEQTAEIPAAHARHAPSAEPPTSDVPAQHTQSPPAAVAVHNTKAANKPRTGGVHVVVTAFNGYAELIAKDRSYRSRSPLDVNDLAPGVYEVRVAEGESMQNATTRTVTVVAGRITPLRVALVEPFK